MYLRNLNLLQAIGLPALCTLKVNVLMMVCDRSTMIFTECVLQTTGVIQNFVDNTFINEGLKGTIHRNTIIRFGYLFFNVGIGERVWVF